MKFNMCWYWSVLDKSRAPQDGGLTSSDTQDLGLSFGVKSSSDETDKNFRDLDRSTEVPDKQLVSMVTDRQGF